MITYIFVKEYLFDEDMPIFCLMLLPFLIILDILFIPFQLIFRKVYLLRKDNEDNDNSNDHI